MQNSDDFRAFHHQFDRDLTFQRCLPSFFVVVFASPTQRNFNAKYRSKDKQQLKQGGGKKKVSVCFDIA
jgi:hypothetical protein